MARSSAPRTKIAAVGTLAALGALAAVATASNTAHQQPAPKSVAAVRPAAPRTVVVHRTVGVLTKFVPAAGSSSRAPTAGAGGGSKPKAGPVATRAAAAPSRISQPAKAEPEDSSETVTEDLPEPGVTEGECLPATAGGAPPAATAAGTPPASALASTSAVDRRAARRAERRARRRAHRRAQRRAHRKAPAARPLRTSHPLPEDVPGAVVDACGLAPAPGPSDATTTTPAPAADAQAVVAP